MKKLLRLCTVFSLLIAVVSHAQRPARQQPSGPAIRFDVVSIRPDKNSCPMGPLERALLDREAKSSSHGRFQARHIPLTILIELAFGIRESQLVGAPSWAGIDQFDIDARVDRDLSFEQMRPMLRAVLADRFNLSSHQETRELPAFYLETEGRGIKIHPSSEGSCIAPTSDAANAPPPRINGVLAPLKTCGGIRIQFVSFSPPLARIEAAGVSMAQIADVLSTSCVDRPVVD